MARMVEVRTELEAILVEQALAMARELELASDAAPDGHVLAISEAVALRAGRELTRRAREAAPTPVRPGRARGSPGRACPRGGRRLIKDKSPKAAVTAAGRVELVRRSTRCPRCGLTAYPSDARVGLDGFLGPQATRLACLAAASWSFDVASDRPDEIAGLRIDDETIRRHCHREARRHADGGADALGPGGDR
jgi:hypothetical protein